MSITLGSSNAPQQLILNLDAVFAQSLANNRKQLVDAIGNSNAIFFDVMKGGMYKSKPGGTDIRIPLMYALSPADWYDAYDELAQTPTDGVTDAIYQWRQLAAPVMYNMKEVKQNKQRILDLVETKVKQVTMGIQEVFSTALVRGAVDAGGNTYDAPTSPVTGASGIDPLSRIISFDPTVSRLIGGLDQSTYTWWRNKTKTSSTTTYEALLLEFQNIFNSASLGTGGAIKTIYVDQITYELFQQAWFQKYRQTTSDSNFPFDNIVFKGARMTFDDKVCDVYSNLGNTATYGTAYFINPEFIELDYEEDSDFQMLKDENGKTFQKPTNGDSRLGHVAWMGAMTISNRRKQGVLGKIARTLA